jgi:putative acetyltransferase
MKIRSAEFEDSKDLAKVFVLSVDQLAHDQYNASQREAWIRRGKNPEFWQDTIHQERLLVCELENTVVGFISLKENEVTYLYVHPEYARMGVATFLLNDLVAFAQKNQIKRLVAHASKIARPFFESKGFRLTRVNKKNIHGVILENYTLECTLNA